MLTRVTAEDRRVYGRGPREERLRQTAEDRRARVDQTETARRDRNRASKSRHQKDSERDFPGGPETKISCLRRKGARDLIPDQGTRSHVPQLRAPVSKLKRACFPQLKAMKTWCSQINKRIFFKEKKKRKIQRDWWRTQEDPYWASSCGDWGYSGEWSPGIVARFSK